MKLYSKDTTFLLALILTITLIYGCSLTGNEEKRGDLKITAFLGSGGNYDVQSTLETNIPGYSSVQTDSEGEYIFKDIKPGLYKITTINSKFGRCVHDSISAPGSWALPIDGFDC